MSTFLPAIRRGCRFALPCSAAVLGRPFLGLLMALAVLFSAVDVASAQPAGPAEAAEGPH